MRSCDKGSLKEGAETEAENGGPGSGYSSVDVHHPMLSAWRFSAAIDVLLPFLSQAYLSLAPRGKMIFYLALPIFLQLLWFLTLAWPDFVSIVGSLTYLRVHERRPYMSSDWVMYHYMWERVYEQIQASRGSEGRSVKRSRFKGIIHKMIFMSKPSMSV